MERNTALFHGVHANNLLFRVDLSMRAAGKKNGFIEIPYLRRKGGTVSWWQGLMISVAYSPRRAYALSTCRQMWNILRP